MKKLLAAVIMSVAAIGTAQAAKPSVEDGASINRFCGELGEVSAGIYSLKEKGFDKQYVIDALVSEGGEKHYVTLAANIAYELKSGMNKSYVHVGVAKACVNSMTKDAVK